MLFAAAGLLLLTATANAASLQLARAVTRRREMAVRAAVGAGRRSIVRQLLIENVLAGFFGGVAGLALAGALMRILPSLLPEGFPRLDAVRIDLGVYGFALVGSVVTSGVCGVIPVWNARRVNLRDTLSESGLPVGPTIRSAAGRTRAAIMVGQVAIACVLLVGAGLFTRSFFALLDADRGYDPANVLTARLPLPPGYPAERRGALLDSLTERLRSVPGVTHVAYGTALPFLSLGGFAAFDLRSPIDPSIEVKVQAAQRIVSADYFQAMRLRLVAGRTLTEADTVGTQPVVVVNQTFARQYLGDRAVGFHIPQHGPRAGGIRFANEEADWEICGVVEDMRQDAGSPMQPEIFASAKQVAPTATASFTPIFVIRTAANPAGYASTLHDVLHQEAPTLALDSVMTMEDRVAASLTRPRLYAIVLASFGVCAVAIAAVGLFGVLSLSVAQRRGEIGVRTALGATSADIVTSVLRQAMLIVALGVTVGLVTAFISVRVLSAFLYGVKAHDALTFTIVPIFITMVAVIACIVPARRAASVDPFVAVRCY
jgi:predicted permease